MIDTAAVVAYRRWQASQCKPGGWCEAFWLAAAAEAEAK